MILDHGLDGLAAGDLVRNDGHDVSADGVGKRRGNAVEEYPSAAESGGNVAGRIDLCAGKRGRPEVLGAENDDFAGRDWAGKMIRRADYQRRGVLRGEQQGFAQKRRAEKYCRQLHRTAQKPILWVFVPV